MLDENALPFLLFSESISSTNWHKRKHENVFYYLQIFCLAFLMYFSVLWLA